MKIRQRVKNKRRNVFTEEIKKIALNSNGDEKMSTVNAIETYACGTSKKKKKRLNVTI